MGRKNLSANGTLVERTTNYTMLLHQPDGYTLELVRDALTAKIKTLPEHCGPRCDSAATSPLTLSRTASTT
jgi:hypothetical protein